MMMKDRFDAATMVLALQQLNPDKVYTVSELAALCKTTPAVVESCQQLNIVCKVLLF